jgi:hypothetical protein
MKFKSYEVVRMKRYALSHRSYDFLAMNKQLITHSARYTFIQEMWKNGRRYIIAKRKVFGEDKEEIVRVVIRYD